MLITRNEISQSEALSRIAISRGNAEPEKKPTAEPSEAVEVSISEAPAEEEAEVKAETETVELDEQQEEAEPEDEDAEELYVTIKGREISLKQIEEWESGHMMQSDYTRKTQDLAGKRKQFETGQEEFNGKMQSLMESMAVLDTMINEDTLTDEKLTDLREFDPEQYITYTEKRGKRQKALDAAKLLKPESKVNAQDERQKLWDANPEWLNEGKQTKVYEREMALIDGYVKANGYSTDEVKGISTSRQWQTLIEAAKYRELVAKNAVIAKKVRKAPVTPKPRARLESTMNDKVKEARARLKKTGSAIDAVELRKLIRESNKE